MEMTTLRKELWCRMVCGGKSYQTIATSSMADSFQQWKQSNNSAGSTSSTDDDDSSTKQLKEWLETESTHLAERIVTCCDDDDVSLEEAKDRLSSVLLFHFQSTQKKQETKDATTTSTTTTMDPLLPPVACAILCADMSAAAASVVLSHILPTHMPLLALTQNERVVAAQSLHSQFYLLACYHVPLLVFHLDRYAPGWYWPKTLVRKNSASTSDGTTTSTPSEEEESVTQKGRNLQGQGAMPPSWLVSHLAGECSVNGATTTTMMNPKWLLSLWDLILTSANNSLRFFLSLALLEKHADSLLMLTGDALLEELHRILEFRTESSVDGFAIDGEEETTNIEAMDFVQEWCSRARSLWEETPKSVVERLRSAEDEAFKYALQERQLLAEQAMQAKLEEEARVHREQQALERERKAEQHCRAVTRQRLMAYYQKHNPTKTENVDTLLDKYEGRWDQLDAKLRAKYGGVGFRPMLRPATTTIGVSNFLSSVNQGIKKSRQQIATNMRNKARQDDQKKKVKHGVTVTVDPSEVLPVVCWTKEAAAAALADEKKDDNNNNNKAMAPPLRYYLVDSRPDETCEEEGRFPTALNMSPEALLDPDRIKLQEEMFESLRGTVHIVVMGEGFSAIPKLYENQRHMSNKLQGLVAEDESRTSLCALFFVKKGFPFVSILEGGFCAAHTWLWRDGPAHHLDAKSVLVDYSPLGNGVFASLERTHQENLALASASTAEKTSRMVQNLVDSSMVTLTRKANQLENFAAKTSTQLDNLALDIEATRVQVAIARQNSIPSAPSEVAHAAVAGDLAFEEVETKKSNDSETNSDEFIDVSLDQKQAAAAAASPSMNTMKRFTGLGKALAGRVGGIGGGGSNVTSPTAANGEDEENKNPADTPSSTTGKSIPGAGAFARLSQAASSALKKDENAKKEEGTDASGSGIGTFARLSKVASSALKSTSDANKAPPPPPPETDQSSTLMTESSPPPPSPQRFVGLGAALSKAPSALKSNPFSRFNKPTTTAAASTDSNAPAASSPAPPTSPKRSFGGINMSGLRSRGMQTFSNLTQRPEQKQTVAEEEDFDFDDDEINFLEDFDDDDDDDDDGVSTPPSTGGVFEQVDKQLTTTAQVTKV
uniref:Rhodanese domain-containing protein n=1 Tax=Grammatophora oceanica TaxID=210454 RepID=A0A7S1UZ60_9STRA